MHSLYLIAIMPPHDVSQKIRAIQEEFSKNYHCKAALKNPVHATLIPPFRVNPGEEELISKETKDFLEEQHAIEIRINGFDSFKRNEVIFLKTEPSEKLTAFQKSLEDILVELFPGKKLRSERPYHPHFTIGYRDIPHENFQTAEKEYKEKEFGAGFVIDVIYLWKHNGKSWDVHEKFPFAI